MDPLLEGLEAARRAAAKAAAPDDEVTVEDLGDRWVFEFIPYNDQLGGGARVWVAKDGFGILDVALNQ